MRNKIPVIFSYRKNLPKTLVSGISIQSEQEQMNLPDSNIQGLREAITYFTRLRDSGRIDDAIFQDLVVRACAVYVDKEVQRQVDKMLTQHLSVDKIMEYLS